MKTENYKLESGKIEIESNYIVDVHYDCDSDFARIDPSNEEDTLRLGTTSLGVAIDWNDFDKFASEFCNDANRIQVGRSAYLVRVK